MCKNIILLNMSHFTTIKTCFRDLNYLEKALTKLKIKSIIKDNVSNSINFNNQLIIPQLNGHDIQFSWNGYEYDLVFDISFWEQSYPVESFIDNVAQAYANETIISESQKEGFQPIESKINLNGSKTLILQRWGN